MNTYNTLTSCLHLLTVVTLVTARIVPNYYPSATKNQEITAEPEPQLSQLKWHLSNLNSEQTRELGQIVMQGLEHIVNNGEQTNHTGDYELKTTAPQFVEGNERDINEELHLSDPYVLKVPVPQPYPVHIPVKQPFTVPIFKLVPQEVEKRIPIPVEKLVPVYKEKPVKVIVEKHHPYTVYKPYPVPVAVNTHVLLENKNKQHSWL